MPSNCSSCHGQLDCLQMGSQPLPLKRTFKLYQKIRSYGVWYFENVGLWGTLGHVLSRRRMFARTDSLSPDAETLGLRPGELVEVKTIDEILATLGPDRKYRGLLWMTGMRKFCGRRYRVLKRIENILLETNGERRKMKNTVSLAGVMCDGAEFGSCDRACFHFWREAWLRRVAEETNEEKSSADAGSHYQGLQAGEPAKERFRKRRQQK